MPGCVAKNTQSGLQAQLSVTGSVRNGLEAHIRTVVKQAFFQSANEHPVGV